MCAVLCLVTQSCPTLCDPMAGQTPLSMEFSRQESWSMLLCLPPGDLPNSGIEPRSPALLADSLLTELPGKPKNTGVFPNPVIEVGSLVLQADSLTS